MTHSGAKRVEPRRLYQQIADQLRGLIRDGQFPAQSRLPAERDLAQQLGVSRPSLREALIALETEGSVEIKTGSGIYVSPSPAKAADPAHSAGDSPSQLIEARLVLEGAVVVLACARMTAPALNGLSTTLDKMRTAVSAGLAPLDEDRQFHVAIAHQAGNSILVRLVGELFDSRHSQTREQIRTRAEPNHCWAAAVAEHEAIYAALDAADPLGAEAAMRSHLRRSAERWIAAR